MIVEERIARVKQLLERSDLPLGAIARRTGFAHVEYLSSLFKKRTGVSPGKFRRSVAQTTQPPKSG